MKKLSLGIASTFLFVTIAALAANFTDDQLQFGKPGSSANKEIVFGASNKKKLKHVPGTLTLDYEGNNLSVGDGLNTSDKTLKLNKGASSPTFRHNFTSGDLEIENAPVLNQKGNTVSVGDGTNTNKVLKFNKGASSPEIRYNSATGKLQFTNDTTTYKDIGSGSGGGGGTNLLQEVNPDFESGTLNWTASGGTFIAETTTPLFGLQSGDWDSNASGQTLSSALVTIQRGFIGKKCTADLEYRWPTGVSGDLSFQVVDQVPNILATVALEPTTGSNIRKAFLAFDCPTTATDQLRARLISNVTNPAVIDIDDVFVGVNKSTVNVSQARFAGESFFEATAGCTWSYTLSTLGQFNTTAACPGPTIVNSTVGTWLTTDTDRPIQTIQNLPAGTYKATFWVRTNMSIAAGSQLAINDGLTTCQPVSGEDSASASSGQTVSCSFTYTSPQASRSFQLYGAVTSNTILIQNSTGTLNNKTKFMLEYYPLNSAEALNLETTGWFAEANIGGASPSLGAAAVTSYAEIADAGLSLISHPNSAPIGIACSSGNASTVGSTTCSAGNETLGVTVNIPYAGIYEACTSVSPAITGSSQLSATFQLVETPSSGAFSIVQESQEKNSAWATAAAGADGGGTVRVCSRLNFASAGQRTIKLVYEKIAAASAAFIYADRLSSLGDRSVVFTIRPYTQNFPAPVFTDLTNSLNSKISMADNVGLKTCIVRVNGPDTLAFATPGCVSSLTDTGTGRTQVNWTAGVWPNNDVHNCTCTLIEANLLTRGCKLNGFSATSIEVFRMNEANAGTENSFSLECKGR